MAHGRHGHGKLTTQPYIEGGVSIKKEYEGEFVGGVPHGKGSLWIPCNNSVGEKYPSCSVLRHCALHV